MRVAIVGTRDCGELDISLILSHIPQDCGLIVSGGARGVDAYAAQAARALGVPLKNIQPDYRAYGKRAPLVRNEEIVKEADLVLAFWDFRSMGTANTIDHCIRQRTPVHIVGLDECRAKSTP